jgi:hypothetical protein
MGSLQIAICQASAVVELLADHLFSGGDATPVVADGVDALKTLIGNVAKLANAVESGLAAADSEAQLSNVKAPATFAETPTKKPRKRVGK